MKISFDSLEEKIKQREKEIASIRQGIAGLLIVNSRHQAVVDPDKTEQANEIMKQINDLKTTNDNDKKYITYCHAVFKKHGMDSPSEVNISQAKADLQRTLDNQLGGLKEKLIINEINGAEFDELKARLKSPVESRIAELISIENEISAFKEKQAEEVKSI
jgi:hypothetical protein